MQVVVDARKEQRKLERGTPELSRFVHAKRHSSGERARRSAREKCEGHETIWDGGGVRRVGKWVERAGRGVTLSDAASR